MKVGDLVKMKGPPDWYRFKLSRVGIVLNMEHKLIHLVADYPRSRVFVTVHWSDQVSTIYQEDLEVISESR